MFSFKIQMILELLIKSWLLTCIYENWPNCWLLSSFYLRGEPLVLIWIINYVVAIIPHIIRDTQGVLCIMNYDCLFINVFFVFLCKIKYPLKKIQYGKTQKIVNNSADEFVMSLKYVSHIIQEIVNIMLCNFLETSKNMSTDC